VRCGSDAECVPPRLLGILLGLFGFTASGFAETSVWKVSRGTGTLYLGGTCHLLRAEDFPLPPEFDAAFAASTKLIFETDVGRLRSPEMQAIIADRGMFSDGKTLDQVLTPAAWKAAQGWAARAGLPAEYVSAMRPWLFTVVMATFELQKLGVSAEGVDLHFFAEATRTGKQTGELEDFEHHIGYITRLGAGHESEMITQSLAEMKELPEKLHGLLTAWRAGDLVRVDALMVQELRTKYPAMYKELLVDRNRGWLPQIEAMLRTPEVEFVLVGVGHLPGNEGLIAQLRARGCTVTQMKAAAAASRK
jgi:uncharacterized protein YbaP (TraB family)